MLNRICQSALIIFLIHLSLMPDISAQITKGDLQISPFIKLNSFNWKEFDDNDKQLLEESGMLFGFGSNAKYFFLRKKELMTEAEFSIYFNKVDYDGFLQDNQGGQTPYKSSTVYFGLQFTANAGWVFQPDKKLFLIPVLGFELEYWNRDIDDGGRFGYDEKYTVFLLQIAGRTKYLLSKNFDLISNLSFKFPLSISENIDLASRGQGGPSDINLNPKSNPRIYIEAGGEFMNASLSVFFETWLLGKSDADQNYHQPESSRKMFGAKLSYNFELRL